MLGPKTTVINPDGGKEKDFAFDYSYWSFDGERGLENGYNECAGEGKVKCQPLALGPFLARAAACAAVSLLTCVGMLE
jgi:hypothetical protein